MTQNLFKTGMEVATGLEGLRRNQQSQNIIANQEQRAQTEADYQTGQREAAAQAGQALSALKQRYADSGDPAIMRQIIMADPEFASGIQKQFGVIDDNTRDQALNAAASLKQMIETNPQEAMNYWQQNLAQNEAFAGLADNFEAGDIEGAMNEIGWGITALGGQEAYDSVYGTQDDSTNFTKDLLAAGIKAGSEEFKAAVLEKYGKGATIGYDVIEGVNPETGINEYYQVSRVNPDETIPLGIAVPVSAATLKEEAADNAKIDDEKAAMEGTLSTIGKILGSDGLGGFSGLDSFRRFIPGSEAANVAAWIDQLQSQNFLTAVSQMKGMGALSENEGKKLASSVAAISPSMSDEAIKSELQAIETSLLSGLERIESGNLLTVGQQTTPAAPTKTAFQPATPASTAPTTVNWSDLP